MPDRTLVNGYAIAFHTVDAKALDFISRYSETAKRSGEVQYSIARQRLQGVHVAAAK